MLLSILYTYLLVLNLIGYSLLFKGFLKIKNAKYQELDFLLGYFFVAILALLLNFFFPLKFFAKINFILGLIIFVYFLFKKKISFSFLIKVFFVTFFLVFISYDNSILYDSRLYHLQTIKYHSDYKVIFGISNLEPRLGMNSIWHLIISFYDIKINKINFYYFFNHTIYIFTFSILLSNKTIENNKIFLCISLIYLLVYSIFHPNGDGTILNSLGSPEVDIVSMFFYLLTFFIFLDNNNFKVSINYKYIILAISVVLGVTVKLNNISLILIVIYFLWFNKNLLFSKINIVFAFFILLWILKSIIGSGCFIFPISQLCFDFSWSLGSENTNTYKNIISSFNRAMGSPDLYLNFKETINSLIWFPSWVKNYFLHVEFLYISTLIFICCIIFIILDIFIFKKIIFNNNLKNYIVIAFISMISLLIWFQAPELRFGYGPIIGLVSILLLIIINERKKLINLFFF